MISGKMSAGLFNSRIIAYRVGDSYEMLITAWQRETMGWNWIQRKSFRFRRYARRMLRQRRLI